MNFDLQSIQEFGVSLPKALAPLGAAYAFWRGIVRHRFQQEAEREKIISQAVNQFSHAREAQQFFHDLQLQQAISRCTGLSVMPAEFAPVYRFMREERASLWALKYAWPYRQPTSDGPLEFVLGAAGNIRWWLGVAYLILCGVAGFLAILLAWLTPANAPKAILLYSGAASCMLICALAMAYSNKPEAAVHHINRQRKR